MRQSKLKDYIIINQNEDKCLYGRVYGDVRFPNGHLVLTTKIVEYRKDENIAITENNTEYLLENELTKEEFIKQVKERYEDSRYVDFILMPLS